MRKTELVLALLACFACAAVVAQTERSGSDTARVMQQVQQLTSERTALQADNEKLKQEIEVLKGQVAKLQGEQGALQRKAQTSEAAVARLTGSTEASNAANAAALERSRTQMQELVARFRETATTLQEVESDRNEARGALSARDQALKVCVDRNAGLYELNSEILAHMEDRGFWSSLSTREPFTRIARTRLENLIDDYRYRVDELRLEKQQTGNQPPSASR